MNNIRDHGTSFEAQFEFYLGRVCEVFDAPRDGILGLSREQRYAWPRQVLCYVLRESGWELARIGEQMNRDHSSVHHACKVVGRRISSDVGLARAVMMVSDVPAAFEMLTDDERALFQVQRSAAEIEESISDAVRRIAASVATLERLEARARSLRNAIENPVQTRGAA